MRIPILLLLAALLGSCTKPPPPPPKKEVPPFDVLMVGWDGSRLARVQEMLNKKKLPVLARIIEGGTFMPIFIEWTKPDTKAGWAEILTGYDARTNRVFHNKNYRPVPEGYTLHERLKARYGDEIRTVLLTGKINNLGIRGPHKICVNCTTRWEGTNEKTRWWEELTKAPTKNNEPRRLEDREGEPYLNAVKSMDFYKNELYKAPNVVKEAKEVFRQIKGKRFFAFIHFEEPDEAGHTYGESSKHYQDAMVTADTQLGELLKFLKEEGMDTNLKLFVMADHGFDLKEKGGKDTEHRGYPARHTFFVSGTKFTPDRERGDRRDYAATLLKLYGFDLNAITPKLEGRPYF